jgi:adenylate cyclase
MAQLIDATSGSHVWGERYEGEVADIFDLQDRVTEAVVGAIEPTITLSEIERVKRKRPESLDAYECVMRALPAVWSQDPKTTSEGLRLSERAMALDPDYVLPKALGAWCYAQRIAYLRTIDPAEDRARTRELAKEALNRDSNDPLVLTLVSAAYTLLREYKLAATLIEKALALDPNSAWAWTRSGWLNVNLHAPDLAIEHFNRAMRLSPVEPMNFNVLFGIGAAYFEKGEHEEAITWVERGLDQKPDAYWIYRLLSAAYANAGRLDDAKRAVALLLEAYPGLTISKVIDMTPVMGDYMRRVAEGLRLAGLPE